MVSVRWVLKILILVWMFAAPAVALAQQEATQQEAATDQTPSDKSDEGDQQRRTESASRPPSESQETGGVFKPSEEISEDLPAPFPVDI